jgi:hypothetical protein
VARAGSQWSGVDVNLLLVGYDMWLSALRLGVVWVSNPVDLGQDCGFFTR